MSDKHVRSGKPVYARPTLAMRLAFAWVAIVCSGTLLGGGLGLFEMQARGAAAAHAQPLSRAANDAPASASAYELVAAE
jgi:hypothetical protein